MGRINFGTFYPNEKSNELVGTKSSGGLMNLEPQDIVMGSSPNVMRAASDAVKPFADKNPNSVDACLSTMNAMYENYSSIAKEYIHEKEETKRSVENTLINAKTAVETAAINADAAITESYNNLQAVIAQCEEKKEEARLRFEEFKKKYDLCMKVLNDAQSSFKMKLEEHQKMAASFQDEKIIWLNLIGNDNDLKNSDRYFKRLSELDNSIIKLAEIIANLKPEYAKFGNNLLPGD